MYSRLQLLNLQTMSHFLFILSTIINARDHYVVIQKCGTEIFICRLARARILVRRHNIDISMHLCKSISHLEKDIPTRV